MQDMPELRRIAGRYIAEAEAWSGLSGDLDRAEYYAVLAMADHAQQILIATDGEHIAGFMWVAIQQQVWTSDTVVGDLFLYVEPEYRGHGIAAKLEAMCSKWAEACVAKASLMGANSGLSPAASRVYDKAGYLCIGTSHFKTFKGDSDGSTKDP